MYILRCFCWAMHQLRNADKKQPTTTEPTVLWRRLTHQRIIMPAGTSRVTASRKAMGAEKREIYPALGIQDYRHRGHLGQMSDSEWVHCLGLYNKVPEKWELQTTEMHSRICPEAHHFQELPCLSSSLCWLQAFHSLWQQNPHLGLPTVFSCVPPLSCPLFFSWGQLSMDTGSKSTVKSPPKGPHSHWK